MNRFALTAALYAGIITPALAQVPVTDVAANVSLVKEIVQGIQSYAVQGQQLLTEARTTAQLVQAYRSFVQNPSLGAAAGLLVQSGLSNSLPINPYSLVGLTSGSSRSLAGLTGKLSSLGGLANTAYSQNHVYDCTDNSWACNQQRQRAYGLAGSSGIAQAGYQDVRAHMDAIQALRDRSATATTPAERENIALALQSEQAWYNNLQAQMQAADMQSRNDDAWLIQRDNEKISQDMEATVAQIP